MSTDKKNKYLSEAVYYVNSNNESKKIHENDKIKEGLKVLAVENNKNNGM